MKRLLCLVLLTTMPASAAPDASARLFERAWRVYGEAQSLALDYTVTSDSSALPALERGAILWRKPDFYAQTFAYDAGAGHFAADAKQIYFTQVDGVAGRYAWHSLARLGFWNDLPWDVPGHLTLLLRGQKLYGANNWNLRALPSQRIEGVWCDGALLQERAGNGDSIRFWFAHGDGTLRRESWRVALPDGHFANVQTRYFNIRLNPKLERSDFVRAAEATAPVVDPDAVGRALDSIP